MHIILFLAAIALLTLLPAGRITAIEGYPATLPANPPTDQILVMFSDDTPAFSPATMARRIDRLSEAAGAELTFVRPLSGGGWVFRLPARLPERDVAAMARRLTALPEVAIAEPDRILTHTGDQNARPALPVTVSPRAANQTPDDPQFPDQWHYDFVSGVSEGLNLLPAWDITTGSSAIVVAVLDTGIRPHADLAGRVLPGYDFITPPDKANDGDHQSPENSRDPDPSDPGDWVEANGCGQPHQAMDSSWHGTHVAGTIGAASNNGEDVAGVDWQAQILPVRVLGRCGGTDWDIAMGLLWASGGNVNSYDKTYGTIPVNRYPSKVINLSLGYTYDSAAEAAYWCRVYNQIGAVARGRGSILIAAAGNESSPADRAVPASCSGFVSVAATTKSGARASYSNYGPSVDVAGPGGDGGTWDAGDIRSTFDNGAETPGASTYAWRAGTSMAAPAVSGAAALAYSVGITHPDVVERVLKATARRSSCGADQCGAGVVSAHNVVRAKAPTSAPRIRGAAVPGKILRATNGTWRNSPQAVQLTWYRGSTKVRTGPTYRTSKKDVGKRITVRATATGPGTSAAIFHQSSVVVKWKSKTTVSMASKVKKSKRATMTVKVSTKLRPTGVIRVYDGKKRIAVKKIYAKNKGKVKIKLPKLKKGKHKLTIVYSGNDKIHSSTRKKVVRSR